MYEPIWLEQYRYVAQPKPQSSSVICARQTVSFKMSFKNLKQKNTIYEPFGLSSSQLSILK